MRLLAAISRLFRSPARWPYASKGGARDLGPHIERLVRSPDDGGTLIVQAANAEPFIQFTGGPSGVEMDFPLITGPQRSCETALRRFFDARRLKVRVSFGSDGSGFLDVDLPADPPMITELTQAAFAEVFGVDLEHELEFRGSGLGVAA
jgi:hypothetical protein